MAVQEQDFVQKMVKEDLKALALGTSIASKAAKPVITEAGKVAGYTISRKIWRMAEGLDRKRAGLHLFQPKTIFIYKGV